MTFIVDKKQTFINMKTSTLLFLLFFSTKIFSQNLPIQNFNQERLDLNRKGMTILGSWAGANIITNGILLSNALGSDKAFYKMNIYWNVVNGALASLSLLQKSKNQANMSPFESLEEQGSTEKIFLFNMGLDVAYLVDGIYLLEKLKTLPPTKTY